MPQTVTTWRYTHKLQLTRPIFIYGLRHLSINVYARNLKPEARSEIQQLSVDEHILPDWLTNVQQAICWRAAPPNLRPTELRKYWEHKRRSSISYKPLEFARYMQYREEIVPGAPFLDDAWSLNMHNVRGACLYEVMGAERVRNPTAAQSAVRGAIEKAFLALIATPGSYEQIITMNDITIEDKFETRIWFGVPLSMVDNAHEWAVTYLREIVARPIVDGEIPTLAPEWTAQEAIELLALNDGVKPPDVVVPLTILTRSPLLPWRLMAWNVIQYYLSHWENPDMIGIRREPGSCIQNQIDQNCVPEFMGTPGMVDYNNPDGDAFKEQQAKKREVHQAQLQQNQEAIAAAERRCIQQEEANTLAEPLAPSTSATTPAPSAASYPQSTNTPFAMPSLSEISHSRGRGFGFRSGFCGLPHGGHGAPRDSITTLCWFSLRELSVGLKSPFMCASRLHNMLVKEVMELFVDNEGPAVDGFEEMMKKLRHIFGRFCEEGMSLSAVKTKLYMTEAVFAGATKTGSEWKGILMGKRLLFTGFSPFGGDSSGTEPGNQKELVRLAPAVACAVEN
ncbi:hypothetical protein C8R43DRAFT_957190 [Mycena crocata]|nr:hypothetical protein C8R43DRAFT_957190 [Mycena crocata]